MSLTCTYCNITVSRSDKIKSHKESETHKLNVIISEQRDKINQYEEMLNKFRELLGQPLVENTKVEEVVQMKKRGRKSKNIDSSESNESKEEATLGAVSSACQKKQECIINLNENE